ncbi:MAG: ankyrin repeat domain-containing protein, partial [Sedimentisphaerales bacterium]|nr:ankyrin repeat domain-containing protein [Sedimentisphaerales bacterium]
TGFGNGDTPLHAASHLGNVGLVKMLIAARANIEALNDYGQTPLQYAAAFGNKDIVVELLKAGADIKRKNPAGLDTVTIAEKTKNQEIADILKNHTKEN